MMTRLPLCPKCEEEELRRVPGTKVRAKCYECGYDSGILSSEPGEDDIALIEDAVRAYKAKKEQA